MYFLAKISELLDTVFFVLRKKDRQITFLHMYHHTVMPMISWGATKYYPGGHGTFIGVVNSFVHIIMYSYYLLAAMGPQYQKFLWWKKYITNMQMVSTVIVVGWDSSRFLEFILIRNSLLNSRSNFVWRSSTLPNWFTPIADIRDGPFSSRCQMQFSSTSCSTISIANRTKVKRPKASQRWTKIVFQVYKQNVRITTTIRTLLVIKRTIKETENKKLKFH